MRYMFLVVCLGLISSCTEPSYKLVGLQDHAIFDAAEKGDLQHVRRLVHDNPAVVNSYPINKYGKPCRTDSFTPLHMACLYGRYEVAKFLLDNGANVNAVASAGWTPLHEASDGELCDDPRVVQLLIDRGADIRAKWANDIYYARPMNLQPIHLAARSGRLPKIKVLLAAGADATVLDGEGKNALNHALAHKRPKMVKFLRDDLGLTPAINTSEIGLSAAGHWMQNVSAPGIGGTGIANLLLTDANMKRLIQQQRHMRGGSTPPCDKTGRKPVLDQAQLVYDGGLSARTLRGYSHWQSFSPAISGKLVQIDIGFFKKMRGDGKLALYEDKGIKGERMCSIPVSVAAGDGGGSWNSYTLNAVVSAGKQYTFHFTPNPQTLPDPYGVCIGAKSSLYKRGVFMVVDPSGEHNSSSQSVFRTHVIPAAIQRESKEHHRRQD